MKTLILYGSPKKLTNAHKKVYGYKQSPYFVRVDTFNGDVDEALSWACKFGAMPSEIVLNTVDIHHKNQAM